MTIEAVKFWDYSAPTPAMNLAMDEALLENAELGGENGQGAVLRFWESPEYFVTLGYTNKIALEADEAECARRGIPILRRATGGGTVVQGPGCINYALIVPIPKGQALDVGATNDLVMETTRVAVQELLKQNVSLSGYTDLAIEGRKFSGNAQKRKRHFLLFHGTFLLDFNIELVQHLLRVPPKMPDYRHTRSHRDFITNISANREPIKEALKKAWGAQEELEQPPFELAQRLIEEKYERDEWNLKF